MSDYTGWDVYSGPKIFGAVSLYSVKTFDSQIYLVLADITIFTSKIVILSSNFPHKNHFFSGPLETYHHVLYILDNFL